MPRTSRQSKRPSRLQKPAALPTGPRAFGGKPQIVAGPGSPPPGFLGATNSVYEWMVYWGLAKIFNNPQDPRQGPFEGGWPDWGYQAPVEGGRRQLGGAVIDFIVYEPGRRGVPVAIRIVTEAWHIFTTARKQANDTIQRTNVENQADVVDIYDYEFINDPTGQAVIVRLKEVLGLIERVNPLLSGTALRGSRMRMPA